MSRHTLFRAQPDQSASTNQGRLLSKIAALIILASLRVAAFPEECLRLSPSYGPTSMDGAPLDA